MRVTWTMMNARIDSAISGSANPSARSSSKRSWSGRTYSPWPCRRRIRGGPSNAQNITQMRPLSRRWAIVSAPLPTMSR